MTITRHPVVLSGLDALNPLAFLAALGSLLAAHEYCQRTDQPPPAMSFDLPRSVCVPTLWGPHDAVEAWVEVLVDDLERLAGRGPDKEPRDPFLAFSYSDDKGKAVHDLKPPPEVFRAFGEGLIEQAGPDRRRTVDWAAATLTDVAVDGSGHAKPFALHFTAGQQRFLTIARELLDGAKAKPTVAQRPVDAEDLRAALVGPWPDDRELKVFSWNPAQDRAYALRASDPSGDKKLGTPGADWLALRGVGLMSSAPVGTKIGTGGTRGGWKSGTFSYPVWPRPLGVDALRSLLRHPALGDERAVGGRGAAVGRTLPRGVEVLTCRIMRSDQGGYGAFSRPARD